MELVHHIEKSLPRLEEQIEAKLAETQDEMEKYGSGPPTEAADRLCFLIDKVTAFVQDAINLSIGEELKSAQDINVFSQLRVEFCKWKTVLDKSGVKFDMRINKEINEYEVKYRGRELPGFINYKTFEAMVREQIKHLEEPAVKKLKEISDLVRKAFIQLAQSSFVGYPNLLKTAKSKIEAIKQEKNSLAESQLRTHFKMELIVYTQDHIYSERLSELKTEEKEDEDEDDMFPSNGNSASLKEMLLHLKSYYNIASLRLADQLPLVVRYLHLQEAALQLQREMLQLLQEREATDHLLKEDFDVGSKRAALQSRKERLMKARNYLVGF